MILNAQQAKKELLREGYAEYIKSIVEQKKDLCVNWRARFDEEFKVDSIVLSPLAKIIQKNCTNTDYGRGNLSWVLGLDLSAVFSAFFFTQWSLMHNKTLVKPKVRDPNSK